MSYTITIKFPKLGVAGSNPVCRSKVKLLKIRYLRAKATLKSRLFLLFLAIKTGLKGGQ